MEPGTTQGRWGKIADVFQKEWRQKQRNGRLDHETWGFHHDLTMQHGDLAIKHDDFKSNMAVFHLAKWFFLHGGF